MLQNRFINFLHNISASLLLLLVKIYRNFISPFMKCNCRFIPSCSTYSVDALKKHGALKGFFLTSVRLSRCHPFADGGLDEVPETFTFLNKTSNSRKNNER